jgi:hypothetical protein
MCTILYKYIFYYYYNKINILLLRQDFFEKMENVLIRNGICLSKIASIEGVGGILVYHYGVADKSQLCEVPPQIWGDLEQLTCAMPFAFDATICNGKLTMFFPAPPAVYMPKPHTTEPKPQTAGQRPPTTQTTGQWQRSTENSPPPSLFNYTGPLFDGR